MYAIRLETGHQREDLLRADTQTRPYALSERWRRFMEGFSRTPAMPYNKAA